MKLDHRLLGGIGGEKKRFLGRETADVFPNLGMVHLEMNRQIRVTGPNHKVIAPGDGRRIEQSGYKQESERLGD